MNSHDDAFDAKFAPEFGQGDDAQSESMEDLEEDEDVEYDESYEDEDDDDSYDAYHDDEDDDDDDEEDESLDESGEEESIPLSRYNELRKFATQRSMELADLKRSLLTKAPEPPVAQEPVKQKGVLARTLDDIVESKVSSRLEEYLAPIREQEEELAVQTKIISLAEQDPDFSKVSQLFLKQLETAPQLFDIDGGLDIAYKAAKAEYLEKVTNARVKAETEQAIRRKSMKENITDGSTFTRPTQNKAKSEADLIRESILGLGVKKTF